MQYKTYFRNGVLQYSNIYIYVQYEIRLALRYVGENKVPRKGFTSITITEKSDEQLNELKDKLSKKSKSRTAQDLIDEKYDEVFF